MGLLSWLFGKKEQPAAPAPPAPTVTTAPVSEPARPSPEATEAENLRRWRASGRPRAWVEARRGAWNHDDWLALLAELRQSPFWPMQPEAVGMTLEEAKREWLSRN